MPEERNDGKVETAPAGRENRPARAFSVAAQQEIAAIFRGLPWAESSLRGLLHGVVDNLRASVEERTQGPPEDRTAIELQYDVAADYPNNIPLNLNRDEAFGLALGEYPSTLLERGEPEALRRVTRGVAIVQETDESGRVRRGPGIVLSADLQAEVNALPEEARQARLVALAAGVLMPIVGASSPASPSFSADLFISIHPICVTYSCENHTYALTRQYYPIRASLLILEGDPPSWSEDDCRGFWAALHASVDALGWAEDLPPPNVITGTARVELPGISVSGVAKVSPKPSRVVPLREVRIPVPAGFVPMHKLAKRRPRSGLLLYPEERREFYELRTPLCWAVGVALFAGTSEKVPGDWQEITIADLEDRVFCLTERDANRRGDHRTDILAEVVKLHTARQPYVRYDWVQRGRISHRTVAIGSDYAIPNLELVFIDKRTGRTAYPADPTLRSLAIPLNVKGRRAYTPDGKDIRALPNDRFKLDRLRWRWNPSFADDLLVAPALDAKGKIRKDAAGKVLRGGFNIKVSARILSAADILRSERAYVAHDLLILLAHDIYKPPKQSTVASRNIIDREAERLFDLLGLDHDPKHPERREAAVEKAVFRLKQPDIAALLPGSDERPRTAPNQERRKAPFYRFIRAAEYTPAAALVTKEEAVALEAESRPEAEAIEVAPVPKTLSGPAADQAVLPGMILPPEPSLPSGPDLKAALAASGMTIRAFAAAMKGPNFSVWSKYSNGKTIRTEKIPPEVWQRVRDFVAQHGPKANGGGGGA